MIEASDANVAGLTVSRETMSAMKALSGLVEKWNTTINLVGKSTLPDIWSRHIVDSAQLFALAPRDAKSWLDLGSGGGFPGLVIAILAREATPDLVVTLVESDLRKATFLRLVGQELNLAVQVKNARIESLAPIESDVISARALAPLPKLLEYAEKHLRADGVAIFPKGMKYNEELSDSRKLWNFDCEAHQSLSGSDSAILVIRNIHRAD